MTEHHPRTVGERVGHVVLWTVAVLVLLFLIRNQERVQSALRASDQTRTESMEPFQKLFPTRPMLKPVGSMLNPAGAARLATRMPLR